MKKFYKIYISEENLFKAFDEFMASHDYDSWKYLHEPECDGDPDIFDAFHDLLDRITELSEE